MKQQHTLWVGFFMAVFALGLSGSGPVQVVGGIGVLCMLLAHEIKESS